MTDLSTIKTGIIDLIAGIISGLSGVSSDVGEAIAYFIVISLMLALLWLALGAITRLKGTATKMGK